MNRKIKGEGRVGRNFRNPLCAGRPSATHGAKRLLEGEGCARAAARGVRRLGSVGLSVALVGAFVLTLGSVARLNVSPSAPVGLYREVDRLVALDVEHRRLLAESERLKAERNAASREIGRLIGTGEDNVQLAYHTDGTLNTRKDQRGTTLLFAYDELRRPQAMQVTPDGTADPAVQSITRGYDTLGRRTKTTSHGNDRTDPNNTTSVKNQVVFTYNDLNQVTKSEQSRSGVVGGALRGSSLATELR